jgi:LytS/YehU family sensor histidine kinase
VARIIGKGRVTIEVRRESKKNEQEFMVAKISDNGPGIDLSKIHTSTGLNNILTRLEQIYELKNLLYFENTGNGTLVTIKIPI